MVFIIGLLTVAMVLDCAVLIFLVLIQLPKKEAGAGLAFGGSATDALFGAGSGNVLTKITKYSAATFFILAVFLSVLESKHASQRPSELLRRLESAPQPLAPSVPAASPAATPAPSTPVIPLTSTNLLSAPQAEAANTPAPATNNPPAAAPKSK